jgi:hypothetical protein
MSEWLPAARALGIVLLALACVWPVRTWQRWVVAAAGAAALTISARDASFVGHDNSWAVLLAFVVALAGWWAVPHARIALARFGGSWWVLLGSAAAVYGCVPETDQMREVAVVVAAGGVVELLLHRPLPAAALAAAFGLVEWSALYGATGQARALAGGLFALTPLVAVGAVACLLAGDQRTPRRWWLPWAVAATWVAAALTMARTGGIATSLPPAAWAAAVCGVAAASISAVLVRLARR